MQKGTPRRENPNLQERRLKISMFKTISSKTRAGRSKKTDFQKSFPPTKRNKASERIEFSNGVCDLLLYVELSICNCSDLFIKCEII